MSTYKGFPDRDDEAAAAGQAAKTVVKKALGLKTPGVAKRHSNQTTTGAVILETAMRELMLPPSMKMGKQVVDLFQQYAAAFLRIAGERVALFMDNGKTKKVTLKALLELNVMKEAMNAIGLPDNDLKVAMFAGPGEQRQWLEQMLPAVHLKLGLFSLAEVLKALDLNSKEEVEERVDKVMKVWGDKAEATMEDNLNKFKGEKGVIMVIKLQQVLLQLTGAKAADSPEERAQHARKNGSRVFNKTAARVEFLNGMKQSSTTGGEYQFEEGVDEALAYYAHHALSLYFTIVASATMHANRKTILARDMEVVDRIQRAFLFPLFT